MDRHNLLRLARIAEQTGRFDDMSEMMKGIVSIGGSLNKEERGMLSSAYRHLVGERRHSWRMVSSGYNSLTSNDTDKITESEQHDMLDIMRCRIEDEIIEYCDEMQDLLSRVFLNETCAEGQVSLLKMKGDYFRYAAEILTDQDLDEELHLAHQCYTKAYQLAVKSLSPVSATRLGLALNFSVFFYELVKSTDAAIDLAENTYGTGNVYLLTN